MGSRIGRPAWGCRQGFWRGLWLGLALLAGTGAACAQENLDEGKSAAQLFASACSACHKSPQGLAKSANVGAMTDFLRQHYTASKESAGLLAGYLAGVSDPRGPRSKPDVATPPRRDTRRPATDDDKDATRDSAKIIDDETDEPKDTRKKRDAKKPERQPEKKPDKKQAAKRDEGDAKPKSAAKDKEAAEQKVTLPPAPEPPKRDNIAD